MPTNPIRLQQWRYLGAEKISAAGAQSATLPTGTTIVAITAETAAVRYKVNGTADTNSTPVPKDQTRVIGPINGLTSFGVFNASSSVAYLEYYKEV